LFIRYLFYTSHMRWKKMGDKAYSGHSCIVETWKFNYFALYRKEQIFETWSFFKLK
jgi:hypothetical protein